MRAKADIRDFYGFMRPPARAVALAGRRWTKNGHAPLAPPSNHIPLRRRCAFGGSIPHQTTPSCWLQRTGPLAASVLTHWRRKSRRKWLVGVDRLRCKWLSPKKGRVSSRPLSYSATGVDRLAQPLHSEFDILRLQK